MIGEDESKRDWPHNIHHTHPATRCAPLFIQVFHHWESGESVNESPSIETCSEYHMVSVQATTPQSETWEEASGFFLHESDTTEFGSAAARNSHSYLDRSARRKGGLRTGRFPLWSDVRVVSTADCASSVTLRRLQLGSPRPRAVLNAAGNGGDKTMLTLPCIHKVC